MTVPVTAVIAVLDFATQAVAMANHYRRTSANPADELQRQAERRLAHEIDHYAKAALDKIAAERLERADKAAPGDDGDGSF